MMPAHAFTFLLLLLVDTIYAAPTRDERFLPRDSTCGGNPALAQCGGSFPSDFCCPHSSICLPLNVTGGIAIVCCPPGVDCRTIQPTTCEQGAYNASVAVANQIHASPITALDTCGSACCPAGFSCRNGQNCVAKAAAANTTPSASTQSLPPVATTTAGTSAAPAVADNAPQPQATSTSSFSGSSFAAGFVPGIVLGMLLLAAIIWILRRRRAAKGHTGYHNEKAQSQDQLTGLSPIDQQQRFKHLRSISEPTMMANSGRTDFLRSSPSDVTNTYHEREAAGSFETIEEEAPSRSDPYEPKPMFQFSPSIRQPRSPLPSHLKRGTLSYAVSPIRQLRTKKSVQSLRRHAVSPVSQRSRASIVRTNSSVSTETIQVLMTPDQRPSYYENTASSIYTPSRQPTNPRPAVLGSPYSYQQRQMNGSASRDQGSSVKNKRVTTFSSLMERAGLRREDLMP